LAEGQCGFKKNSSTTVATYNLLDNIYVALNNRCIVGGIFCDLSKAFDRVNHDILLLKMEFYGIKGTVHKLIKSYLAGRYQRVILYKKGRKCSACKEIQCGVPQGSVLSPLLFLLYINDLPGTISDLATPVLYNRLIDGGKIVSLKNAERIIRIITNSTKGASCHTCSRN
jgi:hypothetical protein